MMPDVLLLLLCRRVCYASKQLVSAFLLSVAMNPDPHGDQDPHRHYIRWHHAARRFALRARLFSTWSLIHFLCALLVLSVSVHAIPKIIAHFTIRITSVRVSFISSQLGYPCTQHKQSGWRLQPEVCPFLFTTVWDAVRGVLAWGRTSWKMHPGSPFPLM